MKWWRKHAEAPPAADVDREEARAAREKAEARLRQVKAQAPEVRNASRKLRNIRERNHFADMIGEALSERTE